MLNSIDFERVKSNMSDPEFPDPESFQQFSISWYLNSAYHVYYLIEFAHVCHVYIVFLENMSFFPCVKFKQKKMTAYANHIPWIMYVLFQGEVIGKKAQNFSHVYKTVNT